MMRATMSKTHGPDGGGPNKTNVIYIEFGPAKRPRTKKEIEEERKKANDQIIEKIKKAK